MTLFDVYPRLPFEPVSGRDVFIYDREGNEYLDLYGGHAVISVGHSHPHFVQAIREQAERLVFYSNAVQIPLQDELAQKLGRLSSYEGYRLFLCNSGAEAVENALKLASFHTGRKKVLAFHGAFHGRTSGAVAVTDNPGLRAPFNEGHEVVFIPLGDIEKVAEQLSGCDYAAVIIEGIQGLAGIHLPGPGFLQELASLCRGSGTALILDEVQSGYGRSGVFFAHQHAGIRPDLIAVAKGMGNGFPLGGVLIHPDIEARHGLLGTTFGGNHLAMAAGIAVLEIIERENLLVNARKVGDFLVQELNALHPDIRDVRGHGLMLGIEFEPQTCSRVRTQLREQHRILTGTSADKRTIRLLPPLTLQRKHARRFLDSLRAVLG